MAKAAKKAKRAKNTMARKKVTKLPDSGKKRFPRIRSITNKAGD